MRPAIRTPTATDRCRGCTLSLKTSTSEIYRLQAAAIQQDLARVGIAVEVRSQRAPDAARRMCARGNFQLYTLQWVGVTDPDMLRRVYHSTSRRRRSD